MTGNLLKLKHTRYNVKLMGGANVRTAVFEQDDSYNRCATDR